MVISLQWAICMRPWIGPKKPSRIIMWARVPLAPGHNRHMLLWDLIDSRWIGMLHRPIHATTLFLNPIFASKCNFDFDDEVLEGILTCIQRMVVEYDTCNAINRDIEVYQDGTGAFGFGDAIRDRTNFMPGMLLIY